MKLSLIALGATACCVLLSGVALAGPCAAQIDMLSKQLAATDAGMGPTGAGTSGTTGTMTPNPVSPSGAAEVPTTPATGAMNEASENKATSPQDVQGQNTGQGTAADQADTPTVVPGTAGATAALQRAQELDRAGDTACMDEITKAQDALGQP